MHFKIKKAEFTTERCEPINRHGGGMNNIHLKLISETHRFPVKY